MEEQNKWTFSHLDVLIKESLDYKEKALLNGVKQALKEQEKRREQNQGELDGTLWSPGEWRS